MNHKRQRKEAANEGARCKVNSKRSEKEKETTDSRKTERTEGCRKQYNKGTNIEQNENK